MGVLLCVVLLWCRGFIKLNLIQDCIRYLFLSSKNPNLMAHTGLLTGMLDLLSPQQVAILQTKPPVDGGILEETLRRVSVPGSLLSVVFDTTQIAEGSPLAGKSMVDDRPTAYFCGGGVCSMPVTNPEAFEDVLRAGREIQSA